MRLLPFFLFSLMVFGQNEKNVTEYANSITPNELKDLLYVYASDYFEGRETGARGQKKAVDFIRQFYTTHEIGAAQGTENYFQPMELNIKGKMVKTENVAAIIEGNEFPNEYIVISSHLDHVGIQNGMIHNGADDDGSGSVAMLEIAEAFQAAAAAGQGPKRSIIFLHVTGEEKGLLGSSYYTKNPLYPLVDTMANLNVDMIGRLDPKRTDKAINVNFENIKAVVKIDHFTRLDIHGDNNTFLGSQRSNNSGHEHSNTTNIYGNYNDVYTRQESNQDKTLTLTINNSNNDVDIIQKGSATHNATITLNGSYGTDLDLLQQGSTAQSYTLSQSCATVGGCSVSVTQGN